jgi:hypothetical protein
MNNSLSTLVRSSLVVPVGKSGAVSRNMSKAAEAMIDASALSIVSTAIYGKGTAKKLAVAQLTGLHTVEYFTNRDSIDGGEWADFLMALIARHGEKTFNPASMKGKAGASAYMRTTIQAIELAGACDGWNDKLQERMAQAEQDAANVDRLHEAALVAARLAAEAAKVGE